MWGLDNPVHIMFVLAIVLLLFGAKRLPEMGRSMGEGLRGFKEAVTGQAPPALEAKDASVAATVASPEAVTNDAPR